MSTMGTTTFALQKQRRRPSFVLVLLATVLALQALSAQTEGYLTLLNKLEHGLILSHPPGCCSLFTGFHPPPPGYGCARCPNVWLFPNVPKTLDPIVGPYPIHFLELMGNGTFCIARQNLLETSLVTIGPKACGRGDRGYEVQIEVTGEPQELAVKFCMGPCFG